MSEKNLEENEEKDYPRIQFRCPPELRERLKEASDDLGMSMSKLIRRCVRASIDGILRDAAITRRHKAAKYDKLPSKDGDPKTSQGQKERAYAERNAQELEKARANSERKTG